MAFSEAENAIGTRARGAEGVPADRRARAGPSLDSPGNVVTMTTMSKNVATRELKTRLGTYLRLVRAGQAFVVTDRGRPVAELRPITRSGDDEAAMLRDLAALGAVTLPSGEHLAPFRPVEVRGGAMSDTVREGRGDRF